MIGVEFAPLTIMKSEDADMDTMIITFNTAVTETARVILVKRRHQKKKKKLVHCTNFRSVRQKEITKIEKIRT